MDNHLLVYYQDREIARFSPANSGPPRAVHFEPHSDHLWVKPSPPSPPVTQKSKHKPKPPADHPWSRSLWRPEIRSIRCCMAPVWRSG
jgi:hypothetical protein